MYNHTAVEASSDIVGHVFAEAFRQQEATRTSDFVRPMGVRSPERRYCAASHPTEDFCCELFDGHSGAHKVDEGEESELTWNATPVNTGCDRLAVVDELLPVSATEAAQARIRELEGQVAILRAMAHAPKPIGMAVTQREDGGLPEMYAMLDDGTTWQRVLRGALGIMTWQQIETVPNTAAHLAEQFSKHTNLKAS